MSAETTSIRSVRARKLAMGLVAIGLAAIFAGSLAYRLKHPGMQKQVRSQASMPAAMGQPGAEGGGMDMGQVREMMEQLQARVEENPHDFQALFQLAEIQLMRQDKEGALAYLDQAREQAGDDVPALHRLSSMYFELKQDQAAADVLRGIVELDPKDAYARYNLGVLLKYRMDDPAGAAEAFRSVVDLEGVEGLEGIDDLKEQARKELESLSGEEEGGGNS